MIPFPEVIDNSMLSDFRSCGGKFMRTYMEHWKPSAPNVHLHAGGAFAHGLEVARRTYFAKEANAEEAVATGLRALLTAYGDFQCPDDSAKSALRMGQALEYYFDCWPLGVDTAEPLLLPSGNRAIEFSFLEPLDYPHPETGNPLIYSGRADMLCSFSNGTWVEDDKTTGALGASWSGQWDLRSQFTGYAWAAKQAGFPVDGVLVRGVAIQKTQFKHEQYLTFRASWEIDRWLKQVHRDLDRMVASWKSGEWDWNLADACSNYGGCPFKQVCKSQHAGEWLDMYFTRKKWDPITRKETVLS
jgi:hypothetical protein